MAMILKKIYAKMKILLVACLNVKTVTSEL